MKSDYLQQQKKKEESRQQDSNKKRHKGNDGKPNPIKYHWGVGRRFYGTLLQESVLAAMLAVPFWLLFKFMDLKVVTINTDYPYLFALFLMTFLVQSFMFRK